MADQPLKSALKKQKVEYEVVTDPVTGAITRRPKATVITAATAAPRPAITAPVLKKPTPENEEDLVYTRPSEANIAAIGFKPKSPPAETVEEDLVYETIPAATTQTAKPATTTAAAAAAAVAEEEEELVYDKTAAAPLTGAAKEAELKKAEKKEERKPGKGKQVDITTLNDVEKMRAFYRYKVKDPFFYTYTKEGNLEIKANNKAKIPAMTIPLRAFSALRPEELEEIERRRSERQAEVEENYVAKMKELRAAYDAYTVGQDTAEHIVLLNEELRMLSMLRNTILYPERWIETFENPDTNVILLEEKHEERKLGYDVYSFKRTDLSINDAFGHYRAHGEATTMKGGSAESTVLFITDVEDPNTGQFHPTFVREFVYKETKYASPYQAYEVERFKEIGDEETVEKLLGTRSARTIKQIISGEKQQPKNPQQLWEGILEALYTQSKEAGSALEATGSARFHLMDVNFGSPEYANALVTVRTKLKEQEEGAPATEEYKQSVISEKEQAKAKVGAIIHNARRFH